MLSTKAISTLLTKEWFEIFAEWITYPVIAVSQPRYMPHPSILTLVYRYCSELVSGKSNI